MTNKGLTKKVLLNNIPKAVRVLTMWLFGEIAFQTKKTCKGLKQDCVPGITKRLL